MKKILFFVLLAILFSCKKKHKDEVQYDDSHLSFIYHIELDSLNRIARYVKTDKSEIFIEEGNFIFENDRVVFNRLNSNLLLLEKKISYLGQDGYATSSVDTVYGANMTVCKTSYKYDNGYLMEADISCFYFQNFVLKDSSNYTIVNQVSNGNIVVSIRTLKGMTSCTDIYTNSELRPSIDIINLSNGIYGKTFNLVKSLVLSYECPCGSSSSSATKSYDYSLDEDNRLVKQIETYTYCQPVRQSPKSRQITTLYYTYYNR